MRKDIARIEKRKSFQPDRYRKTTVTANQTRRKWFSKKDDAAEKRKRSSKKQNTIKKERIKKESR